ncbi:MAG: TIGR02281 family clan AA aspartic protease [Gammaproteobacteria bacterium]|nr:MAG: TIGR02281 family clan AA aspartic protease [Gammaproteobacteria bacterium]
MLKKLSRTPNRASLPLAALLFLPMAALAVVPVEIVGLFKDMAVIRAGGGEKLLKVGETTAQGVTLIRADSREAVVAWQGQQHTLGLSKQVAGQYAEAQVSEVSIPADDLGQYRIRGAINNHYVDFLVDTGASVVALSSKQADALGINYRRGQLGSVQTAQGNAESYFMTLEKVTVAGITAHNVQAAVITGRFPIDILLGMSFLKQVSIRESGGVMTLVQNY